MEDLYRAVHPGLQIIERDDGPTKMSGRFTVFNRWTLIDSAMEGPPFVERVQPGAFAKTISESLGKIRVLFSHGKDPSIGIKPLGTIDFLREEEDGPAYEVTLLDAPYVDALVPALKAGLLGASYHAQVVNMKEDPRPGPSEFNRGGLPERTYTELRLKEFGPTPFPMVDGTEAVVRSITDEMVFKSLLANPDQVRRLMEGAAALEREEPSEDTPVEPEPQHSTEDEAETEGGGKSRWHLS